MVVPDHVGVVKLLQPFQKRHLSHRGDREAILVRLDTDTLQSHEPAALGVSGLIHRPIGAPSNLCHWLVLDTGAVGHGQAQTDWEKNPAQTRNYKLQ